VALTPPVYPIWVDRRRGGSERRMKASHAPAVRGRPTLVEGGSSNPTPGRGSVRQRVELRRSAAHLDRGGLRRAGVRGVRGVRGGTGSAGGARAARVRDDERDRQNDGHH